MTDTFPQFVDLALTRRLESGSAYRAIHYAQAYSTLHPEGRSTYKLFGSGAAIFISPTSPVNKAVGLGLDGPLTRDDFLDIEAFFKSRGTAPTFSVSPYADSSLFEFLSSSGYGIDGFLNVLWRPISSEHHPLPVSPELLIARAGPADAQAWLDITARGFDEVEDPAPETYDILGPNFYAPSSACYLAWLDGQLVAGGGMYVHDGVVELGGTSTHPGFRRKGAHRALIEARLCAAREMGCDLAMFLTEPGSNSQRNAHRAGFSLAYTQVILRKTTRPE